MNRSIPQAAPGNETYKTISTSNSSLYKLPTDIITNILSYVSPNETDTTIKLTCKLLWKTSNSNPLWKEYCKQTGKQTISTTSYKHSYYLTPCVPIDFETISEAIKNTKDTITLLPGTYYEQLLVKKNLTIKAANPKHGATIAYYDSCSNKKNQPCIKVSRGVVTLMNVQILHSSFGSDIWGGNCACIVDSKATLNINNCTLQSDSGRGVVVTNGAVFHAVNCNIHDCAATGLYVGDASTIASITSCNIIRNGSGCRRTIHRRYNRILSEHNHEGPLFSDEEVIGHRLNNLIANDEEVVPPGHSGMYVESGIAYVQDCMISGNSLTGLSVVRGGKVQLSSCDITENGSDAITIEDLYTNGIFGHDINNLGQHRGGIYSATNDNNFESILNDDRYVIIHGSRVRNINPAFIHTVYRPVLEW